MSMKLLIASIFIVCALSATNLTKTQQDEVDHLLKQFNATQINNISNYTVNPTLCLAAAFYYQDTFKNYSMNKNDTKFLIEFFPNVTHDLKIVASYCSLDGNNATWLNNSNFEVGQAAQKAMNAHKQQQAGAVDFFSLGGFVSDAVQLGSDIYHVADSCDEISEGIDHISEGLETAGVIDAAGGGPEDPVGDVIAAVVGGVEAGYGVYQVVKGGVDAVEGVKKTVNDINKDFGGNKDSEDGEEESYSEGGYESSEGGLGLSEQSYENFENMVDSEEFQNYQAEQNEAYTENGDSFMADDAALIGTDDFLSTWFSYF